MIEKRNKKHLCFGLFLILLGILLPLSKILYERGINKIETYNVNAFFDDTSFKKEDSSSIPKNKPSINYIAILEIPKINLKRGLVSKESKNNNISKNVTFLKESEMPDKENTTLIIASHSGTARISYFNDLEKLTTNDLIYFYYQNIKYIYEIKDIYLEIKDGNIKVPNNAGGNQILLTTCSQKHKGYQLIVIGNLIKKENY